ncbi:transcriptional activator RfaH [Henriciella barbarensis]|uniref:Transcriptional activator RfaH n=1 Tax=Henriciella barbarensis TaxID=86342 RepID=A0A399QNM2_9PROT|nr:transcriptional activator RfaH [Henriciella barbarensis]RIJ20478.1 transcriptional activator RfaH [Henriciella barbarensis]
MAIEGSWFAVQTQAAKEQLAVSHLNRQGFETLLPQLWRSVRRSRKSVNVLKPMFPGYVFVKIDMQRMRWRAIDSTVGVSKLIRFGEKPAALPEDLIQNLQTSIGDDGAVTFDHNLREGDQIRVMSGAFSDWLGRVIEMADADRVKVLFGMMTRQVEVTLPKHHLARAV